MRRTYTKKEALKTIIATAKEYKKMLDGMNYLFVYRNRENNHLEYFETIFLPRNYLHLTGVEYVNERGEIQKNAVDFYNKCIKNILTENEIEFRKDGTTNLKLEALPLLVKFLQFSKITAVYNGVRPKLSVERIAGTTNSCLGFVKAGDYYIPNSCLQEDVRNLGNYPSQILAIFSKRADKKENVYKHIHYIAKGVSLSKVQLPRELEEIISLEDYAER